jgi:hypothetical protein
MESVKNIKSKNDGVERDLEEMEEKVKKMGKEDERLCGINDGNDDKIKEKRDEIVE